MRFAFVRNGNHKWGGDLKMVQDLIRGLTSLGHLSIITSEITQAFDAKTVCLIGTASVDHNPELALLQMAGKEYGCIPFHEDELLFTGASYGFLYYVAGALENRIEKDHRFSIEHLKERPHLVFYFDQMKTINALTNYEFLRNAQFVIASSPTEERTILRDAPGSKTRILRWSPGFVEGLQEQPDESFLTLTGLKKGGYILQVGRLSLRKNQLATLLATKDLDIPVVFIAMGKSTPVYEGVFYAVAKEKRRAPVFVISEEGGASSSQIRIISNGGLLAPQMLLSAFANAGLHLHPSFYELPGYTYLESARLGIPTIASEWGALKDYFTDASGTYTLDDRIAYPLPYDLAAMERLVKMKFGQKYPEAPLHPVFQRTAEDMAKDFLNMI